MCLECVFREIRIASRDVKRYRAKYRSPGIARRCYIEITREREKFMSCARCGPLSPPRELNFAFAPARESRARISDKVGATNSLCICRESELPAKAHARTRTILISASRGSKTSLLSFGLSREAGHSSEEEKGTRALGVGGTEHPEGYTNSYSL